MDARPWHRPTTRGLRPADSEGQVVAFVVVLTAALLLCAGLVIDGGLALAARVRAGSDAQSAARAGAEQLHLATYRATGTVVLDPTLADQAARRYLQAAGDQGSVTVLGNVVSVRVTVAQPTQILGVVGLHSLTVSASATATPVRGITTGGQ